MFRVYIFLCVITQAIIVYGPSTGWTSGSEDSDSLHSNSSSGESSQYILCQEAQAVESSSGGGGSGNSDKRSLRSTASSSGTSPFHSLSQQEQYPHHNPSYGRNVFLEQTEESKKDFDEESSVSLPISQEHLFKLGKVEDPELECARRLQNFLEVENIIEPLDFEEQFYLTRLVSLPNEQEGVIDSLIKYLDPTQFIYDSAIIGGLRNRLLQNIFYFFIQRASTQFSLYQYAMYRRSDHYEPLPNPLDVRGKVSLRDFPDIPLSQKTDFKKHIQESIGDLATLYGEEDTEFLYSFAIDSYYLQRGDQRLPISPFSLEMQDSYRGFWVGFPLFFIDPTFIRSISLMRGLIPYHSLWPAWHHPHLGRIVGKINRIELFPHAEKLLSIVEKLSHPLTEEERTQIREELGPIGIDIKKNIEARKLERLLHVIYRPLRKIAQLPASVNDKEFEETKRNILLLGAAPMLMEGLIPLKLFQKGDDLKIDESYRAIPWRTLRNIGLIVHNRNRRLTPLENNILRKALRDVRSEVLVLEKRLQTLIYREALQIQGFKKEDFETDNNPLEKLTILGNYGIDRATLYELKTILTRDRLNSLLEKPRALLVGSLCRLFALAGESSINLSKRVKQQLIPEEGTFWSDLEMLRNKIGAHLDSVTEHFMHVYDPAFSAEVGEIFDILIELGDRARRFSYPLLRKERRIESSVPRNKRAKILKSRKKNINLRRIKQFYTSKNTPKRGEFGNHLQFFREEISELEAEASSSGPAKLEAGPDELDLSVIVKLDEEEKRRLIEFEAEAGFDESRSNLCAVLESLNPVDELPNLDTEAVRLLQELKSKGALPKNLSDGLHEFQDHVRGLKSTRKALLELEGIEENSKKQLLDCAGERKKVTDPIVKSLLGMEEDEVSEDREGGLDVISAAASGEEGKDSEDSDLLLTFGRIDEVQTPQDLYRDLIVAINSFNTFKEKFIKVIQEECAYKPIAEFIVNRLDEFKEASIDYIVGRLPIENAQKESWKYAWNKIHSKNSLPIIYKTLSRLIYFLQDQEELLNRLRCLTESSIGKLSLEGLEEFWGDDGLCYASEHLLTVMRDYISQIAWRLQYIDHRLPYTDKSLSRKLELLRRYENGLAHLGHVTKFETKTEKGRRYKLFLTLRQLLIDSKEGGTSSLLRIFQEVQALIRSMIIDRPSLREGIEGSVSVPDITHSSFHGFSEGEDITFEEVEVERGADCGFRALGMTRAEAINLLLDIEGRKDENEIRERVGGDIRAALIERPLPYLYELGAFDLMERYYSTYRERDLLLSRLNETYPIVDGRPRTIKEMKGHLRRGKRKSRTKRENYDKLETHIQQARDIEEELRNFTLRNDVYHSFLINEFGNSKSRAWLSYIRDENGTGGSGTLSALAQIRGYNVHIWHMTPNEVLERIHFSEAKGIDSFSDIHLYHRDGFTHFNRLNPSVGGLLASELDSESVKEASRKDAEGKGVVGPRSIVGWEIEDVEDLGNCFYDAVGDQLRLYQHPFLTSIPVGTLVRDSLRLRVQGARFRDEEWARDETIDKFVRLFPDCILAVVDTRRPERGFTCYFSDDSGEVRTLAPDMEGIILPENRPILRIASTGNHFMSIRSHPELDQGLIRDNWNWEDVLTENFRIKHPIISCIRKNTSEDRTKKMEYTDKNGINARKAKNNYGRRNRVKNTFFGR